MTFQEFQQVRRAADAMMKEMNAYVRHMRLMESIALAEQTEDDEWRESLIGYIEGLELDVFERWDGRHAGRN